MINTKKITYNCKQNDVIIKIFTFNNEIDELHIGVEYMDEFTVVGYKDLLKAIKKAEKTLKK